MALDLFYRDEGLVHISEFFVKFNIKFIKKSKKHISISMPYGKKILIRKSTYYIIENFGMLWVEREGMTPLDCEFCCIILIISIYYMAIFPVSQNYEKCQ